MRKMGNPAVLFDDIPGYPKGHRVLANILTSIRRIHMTLGNSPDGSELDLTLTTNGSALERLAGPLREAGLRRLTVSLDSLDDATFRAMNGIDFPVARVLAGIDAAFAAGFGGPGAPIKVNMVVRRGLNETSVLPMARFLSQSTIRCRYCLGSGRPCVLRAMPSLDHSRSCPDCSPCPGSCHPCLRSHAASLHPFLQSRARCVLPP